MRPGPIFFLVLLGEWCVAVDVPGWVVKGNSSDPSYKPLCDRRAAMPQRVCDLG